MNLYDFIGQEEHKSMLERVFSKGVRMIYSDALQMLMSERDLLRKLAETENLPEEITKSFLNNLKQRNKVKLETEEKKKEKIKEEERKITPNLRVIKEYLSWEPATAESFFSYFLSRYNKISQMLWRRPQLKGAVSIAQLSRMKGRESIAVIGMVKEIRKMKDGRKIIEIEDPTGDVTVLLSPSTKNAKSIILDEVVGIRGQAGRGIIFADEIIYPDIPLNGEWPRAQRPDAFVVSDIHAGSKKFNDEIWEKFVDYLNKNKQIKYLLIAGDLVDGIGIYQGQDKEVEFPTVEEQFSFLADLMRKIRKDVLIIAIPGNHDPSRDGEPQPKIPEEFAGPLYKLKNFIMLSNPAWINLEGITILLYHGTSLDGLIDSIDELRGVAYKNPSKAQAELLKKRHLSPIFGRNRIFPDREDYLVIDPVPNVFVTGHVHTASISTYRGIRLLSPGTFQERTAFQEKLGHIPTPGKFIHLSLSTGDAKLIDFSK